MGSYETRILGLQGEKLLFSIVYLSLSLYSVGSLVFWSFGPLTLGLLYVLHVLPLSVVVFFYISPEEDSEGIRFNAECQLLIAPVCVTPHFIVLSRSLLGLAEEGLGVLSLVWLILLLSSLLVCLIFLFMMVGDGEYHETPLIMKFQLPLLPFLGLPLTICSHFSFLNNKILFAWFILNYCYLLVQMVKIPEPRHKAFGTLEFEYFKYTYYFFGGVFSLLGTVGFHNPEMYGMWLCWCCLVCGWCLIRGKTDFPKERTKGPAVSKDETPNKGAGFLASKGKSGGRKNSNSSQLRILPLVLLLIFCIPAFPDWNQLLFGNYPGEVELQNATENFSEMVKRDLYHAMEMEDFVHALEIAETFPSFLGPHLSEIEKFLIKQADLESLFNHATVPSSPQMDPFNFLPTYEELQELLSATSITMAPHQEQRVVNAMYMVFSKYPQLRRSRRCTKRLFDELSYLSTITLHTYIRLYKLYPKEAEAHFSRFREQQITMQRVEREKVELGKLQLLVNVQAQANGLSLQKELALMWLNFEKEKEVEKHLHERAMQDKQWEESWKSLVAKHRHEEFMSVLEAENALQLQGKEFQHKQESQREELKNELEIAQLQIGSQPSITQQIFRTLFNTCLCLLPLPLFYFSFLLGCRSLFPHVQPQNMFGQFIHFFSIPLRYVQDRTISTHFLAHLLFLLCLGVCVGISQILSFFTFVVSVDGQFSPAVISSPTTSPTPSIPFVALFVYPTLGVLCGLLSQGVFRLVFEDPIDNFLR